MQLEPKSLCRVDLICVSALDAFLRGEHMSQGISIAEQMNLPACDSDQRTVQAQKTDGPGGAEDAPADGRHGTRRRGHRAHRWGGEATSSGSKPCCTCIASRCSNFRLAGEAIRAESYAGCLLSLLAGSNLQLNDGTAYLAAQRNQ
jgi:hypothetical protein